MKNYLTKLFCHTAMTRLLEYNYKHDCYDNFKVIKLIKSVVPYCVTTW